jgi:TldD protein
MDELVARALDAATVDGIAYADVRLIRPQRFLHLAVRNGAAESLTDSTAAGLGVRVRTRHAWGFASTSSLTPVDVRAAAARAVRVARAAGRGVREEIPVTAEAGPREGRYATELKTDPFTLPPESILEELKTAEARLHVGRAIRTGTASFRAWDEQKTFASSEGASFVSRIVHVGAGVSALAVRGSNVQRRSGPTSFGGDFGQAGYEFVKALRLADRAADVGREALQLLDAPRCPTGRTTLVLGSDQLALQVHESIGHAVELDRILGSEAAFAGTSWIAPAELRGLTYGSPQLNITADARLPQGLGSFGWDDEGVAARATPIVRSGLLVGTLTSREWAARVGESASGGTARADGPDRAPLIRMTNVNLDPGEFSFDELLDGVKDGVYLETNRSWSIDDRRLNFQFGTEVGRRIVDGELGPLVRNPIYAGITPEFWGSLDAVGNRSTWHLWGVPNCGKGQPGQVARVGHGAPAGRFRQIDVRGG